MSRQTRTRAQESRAAIERLYIAMRHLFIRGSYKPLGESGKALIDAMMTLQPEIYGSMADPEKVELDGLLYIFDRLPRGIEECRYIHLISREGFEKSSFKALVPPKRRRNGYRIDEERMYVEMTRGRSDIYDILTHLTFMFVEAEKIRRNAGEAQGQARREWRMLEDIVQREARGEEFDHELACTYLSLLLGRSFGEVVQAARRFDASNNANSLFHIAYWLGQRSREEAAEGKDREILFSSALRDIVGHHIYGEQWAGHIKRFLAEKGWLRRPLHIISANLHSVMNSLYAQAALQKPFDADSLDELVRQLSLAESQGLRRQVEQYATQHGLYLLEDQSGTNISAQVFDLDAIAPDSLPESLRPATGRWPDGQLILVMDYAFGEQAYETMDELLKPSDDSHERKGLHLNVQSISIMGKAGILEGGKGDIMVPTAHLFEGTADNYPFENALSSSDFEGQGLRVCEGPMITVLGTSLQNRDILAYFLQSSWRAIGLEMEGAHYQKAIQAASKIRKSTQPELTLRYAYYASDNPLETGATLASGGLGVDGVKPTYLITLNILRQILAE